MKKHETHKMKMMRERKKKEEEKEKKEKKRERKKGQQWICGSSEVRNENVTEERKKGKEKEWMNKMKRPPYSRGQVPIILCS